MLDYLYSRTTPWAKANKMQLLKNRLLGKMANIIYPLEAKQLKIGNKPRANNVVVSLTSFPARIDKVHLCVKSLLNQDILPNKIILWLAQSQFDGRKVPHSLTELTNDVFEIRYCGDMRSYKKILPTAERYGHMKIVTADDDVFYPSYWLRRLLETSEVYPECVICYRAHLITYDKDNRVKPYTQWIGLSPDIKGPSKDLVAIGVGGILYPEYMFDGEKLDYQLIKTICPTVDDLWLKAIELRKGISVVKVEENSTEWFTIANSQQTKLTNVNVTYGKNDESIKNLIEHYQLC